MNEFFQIAIFISLFCVGLRIISSPGMIGHFLRKRYDNRIHEMKKVSNYIDSIDQDMNNHEAAKVKLKKGEEQQLIYIESHIENQSIERARQVIKYRKMSRKITFYKPIIGCCTCMASLWTILLFPFGHSMFFSELPSWKVWLVVPLFMMFVVAAFNSIIYSAYNSLNKKVESKCS